MAQRFVLRSALLNNKGLRRAKTVYAVEKHGIATASAERIQNTQHRSITTVFAQKHVQKNIKNMNVDENRGADAESQREKVASMSALHVKVHQSGQSWGRFRIALVPCF